MTGTRISDMTTTTALTPGDKVPIVSGGVNYKYDLGTLLSIFVTPEQFASSKPSGVVGDGTDDRPAFTAMLAYLVAHSVNASTGVRGAPRVWLGLKTYLFSGDFSFKGCVAIFEGAGSCFAGFSMTGGISPGSSTTFKVAAGSTLYFDRGDTLNGVYTASPTEVVGFNDSTFRNIAFIGGGSGTKALVEQHCAMHFEGCAFTNSGGIGLWVIGTLGAHNSNEGNANTSSYTRCVFTFNASDGARIGRDGTNGTSDCNVMTFFRCYFAANSGWGSRNFCFLGCEFIACHYASNTLGPDYSDNPNANNLMLGCYREGDGGPASHQSARSLNLGGFVGNGISGGGTIGAQDDRLSFGPTTISGSDNAGTTVLTDQIGWFSDSLIWRRRTVTGVAQTVDDIYYQGLICTTLNTLSSAIFDGFVLSGSHFFGRAAGTQGLRFFGAAGFVLGADFSGTPDNGRRINAAAGSPADTLAANGEHSFNIDSAAAVGGTAAYMRVGAAWQPYGIIGAIQALTVSAPAAITATAPSGGATVDSQSRTSIGQLITDITALQATVASLRTQLRTAKLMA